jgi:hypothetical protein
MFPGQATATPPLPPDIQAQQAQQAQQPQPAAPMFAQMGASIPDPISVLEAQVAKLEQWAADTAPLANQVNPALTTLLIPIAQAGKALQTEIENLKQRTSGQSPQVTGSAPPSVPGNIPDGRPAM